MEKKLFFYSLKTVPYCIEKHFFYSFKRSPLRYEKALFIHCVISLNVYHFQHTHVVLHNGSYAIEIIKYIDAMIGEFKYFL